jgi:hypothetical protein
MSAVSPPVMRFRPVLTGAMITHLITLCKADGSSASLACLSQLALYEYKIQNALSTPAYQEKPREKLINSLGFEDSSESTESERIHISVEALYNLWLASPKDLTVSQLIEVQRYRYENNKMTVDEEKKYETEIIGIT